MLGEAVESSNAAQRQNRPVPLGWGGIEDIAARLALSPIPACRDIRNHIYEFEY